MTVLLYVRRKGWPLKSVAVECSHERTHATDSVDSETSSRAYIEVIERRILLEGDLTEEQKDRIGVIAGRCPIHRTLESRPRIVDEVHVVR